MRNFGALLFVIICSTLLAGQAEAGAIHDAAKSGNYNMVNSLLNSNPSLVHQRDGWLDSTPLMDAAMRGQYSVCALLVSKGADIEARDNQGRTALYYAARFNSYSVCKYLVDSGADVNARKNDGRSPMHMAAFSGNTDMLGLFLANGGELEALDSQGATPFFFAAWYGQEPAMKYLRRRGADVGHKNNENETALHYAAGKDLHNKTKIPECKYLLKRGLEVNAKDDDGETPLHDAAYSQNAALIRFLLKKGANVKALNNYSETPLHYAAVKAKTPDAIKALLDAGADIDAGNIKGRTPLHHSIGLWGGNLVSIKFLIDMGADPNAADEMGWTPLHKAASRPHIEAVKTLLCSGSNPAIRDKDGRSPVEIAAVRLSQEENEHRRKKIAEAIGIFEAASEGRFRCSDGSVYEPPPEPIARVVEPAPESGEKVFMSVAIGEAGSILDLCEDPAAPGTIYAATELRGILVSLDGGRTWKSTAWGRGKVLRVFLVKGVLWALSADSGLIRSADSGATWAVVEVPEGIGAISCLEAPSEEVIYLCGGRGLWVSRDGGGSWSVLAAEGRAVEWVSCDPSNPCRVLIALASGEILYSTDCARWTSAGSLSGVRRLFLIPGEPFLAFACLGDGRTLYLQGTGESWLAAEGLSGNGQWVECACSGKERLLYVLTSRALYRGGPTGPSGFNWRSLPSSVGSDWQSFTISSAGEVLIAGNEQVKATGEVVEKMSLDDVNFEFDSATLTDEAKATLDGVAGKLLRNDALRARIDGHTDSKGSIEYNLELSQKRADSVLEYLAKKGVARSRCEARGHGEEYPVATNETEEGRAKNRRVVIYLMK